jgi:hypothetical protein
MLNRQVEGKRVITRQEMDRHRKMTRGNVMKETFSKYRVDEKRGCTSTWHGREMGKVRDFVRAVDVTVIHIKKRKLQNREAMQDWLSVSDILVTDVYKLQRARKKLDVARSEVLTTDADEDSSLLGCDEMATGKHLRTDALRGLLPPYSRTESTWQHIAVVLRFKKPFKRRIY